MSQAFIKCKKKKATRNRGRHIGSGLTRSVFKKKEKDIRNVRVEEHLKGVIMMFHFTHS